MNQVTLILPDSFDEIMRNSVETYIGPLTNDDRKMFVAGAMAAFIQWKGYPQCANDFTLLNGPTSKAG